nr:zinc finger, CCHC-type [Tanacetum cinerariifolium]
MPLMMFSELLFSKAECNSGLNDSYQSDGFSKKKHFLLSSMSVVYVLTTHMREDGGDNPTVKQVRKRAKWDNDDYVCRGLILNVILRIEESLRVQDSDKPKGNNVVGPSVVNMVEHNNFFRHKGSVDGSSNSLKGQNMFNKSLQVYYVTYVSEAYFVLDDDVAWWVDSGATVHVCKDRCWFKTYESLNDGSILHMRNKSTALVHGRGCVDLRFSSGKIVLLLNVLHVPTIRKNLVSSSVLNNCGYKQVIEPNKFVLSKHGVFIGFGYLSNHMFRLNIITDNIGSAFMSTSKLNDSILCHARLGHVHLKRMQDMFKDGLLLAFNIDTKKFLELIHSDLCDLHVTPSLGNNKYFVTFIDDASRVWGCKAVVRLSDPKLKTLGERGIECIFVRYAEHISRLLGSM